MRKFLLRKRPPQEAGVFAGPPNARAYAIGDVHGRLDLLDLLLGKIRADVTGDAPARLFLVLVGDMIDRGPDSAGVIERVREGPLAGATTISLLGNHEEMLLRVLHGESHLLHDWASYGGYECLASYGLDVARLLSAAPADAARAIREAIPKPHLSFLEDCVDSFKFGDYLMVHAGIRPGVALEDQSPADLRWIRDGFLDSKDPHGLVIVHGHTIVAEPEDHGNRIAIDTGAYRTGALTALVIEDGERRYLQAFS